MKLVTILRIKNQIDTIDECITKLSDISDEIIVLDNGSTDGTLEVYAKYPAIVEILTTEGFNEGRDKIMLHEAAKLRNPDWIFWCDADEVFEENFTRAVAEEYMSSSHNRVAFRMCNFWLSRKNCRYDSEYYLYTLHPQRSMWRNMKSAYFRNLIIHNGDIMGVPGKPYVSPYRLKHYGYVEKKKIEEKLAIYRATDKSDKRDYDKTSPDLPFRTFRFFEFKNAKTNFTYIIFYKYTLNLLWLTERLRLKIKKILS